MPQVDRFSVSLDTELLAAFDRHITSRGYDNRSEAIRDMIRDVLANARPDSGDEGIAAMLTLVCWHTTGDATQRLKGRLANAQASVRGALHVPVDLHREQVAIALQGRTSQVRAVADDLSAMRGISHGTLSIIPLEDVPG